MRRTDRAVTDPAEILRIVGESKILHLGLFDGQYPYVVPLHFGFEFADGRLILYAHCAKEGHKLDLIRRNPNVCAELESGTELISGGQNPCMYGAYYASVIGRGYAETVSDPEQKARGIALLMQNQTGRTFTVTEQMASAVEVIRIVLTEFTAKSRKAEQKG